MGLRSEFQILAGGLDKTSLITTRLNSLTITDKAGMESDTLEIKLVDDSIEVPSKGEKLEVKAGYQNELQTFGLFVVSKIKFKGEPSELTISATSIPLNGDSGFGTLKTSRSQTWRGPTLGDIIRQIARRSNYKAAVHPSLESKSISHMIQSNESDMHFMTRLSRLLDATAKIAGGFILFLPKDGGQTASGVNMPVTTIDKSEVSSWDYEDLSPSKFKSVVAKYINQATQEEKEIREGDGDPAFLFLTKFESEALARRAIENKLKSHTRGSSRIKLKLAGNPSLLAESKIKLTGFRREANGDGWVITTSKHVFNKTGYRGDIVAER